MRAEKRMSKNESVRQETATATPFDMDSDLHYIVTCSCLLKYNLLNISHKKTSMTLSSQNKLYEQIESDLWYWIPFA